MLVLCALKWRLKPRSFQNIIFQFARTNSQSASTEARWDWPVAIEQMCRTLGKGRQMGEGRITHGAPSPPSLVSLARSVHSGSLDGNWQKIGNYDGPLSRGTGALKFEQQSARVPIPMGLVGLRIDDQ
jgi:hypothetical protein